jgi:hypothetical protein
VQAAPAVLGARGPGRGDAEGPGSALRKRRPRTARRSRGAA